MHRDEAEARRRLAAVEAFQDGSPEGGDDGWVPERPPESRWKRLVALASFLLIVVTSIWLWVAGIGGLAILLGVVGGGSALLIAGTARPDRRG